MIKQRIVAFVKVEEECPFNVENAKDILSAGFSFDENVIKCEVFPVCMWEGCYNMATHAGLGNINVDEKKYCDQHCVGGG